jgi:gas vesicle protein
MSDRHEPLGTGAGSAEGTDHTVAVGLVAGAVGIGLGLLFAPRRGAELRHQVGVQMNYLVTQTSSGCQRATHTVGDLAHRSHDVYVDARNKVARRAHDAQRYVREITDAVTMKSHQPGNARLVPVSTGETRQANAQAMARRPAQTNVG